VYKRQRGLGDVYKRQAMLSLMLVQLAKMINELIDLIYPPATIHKACTYRTLLNAVLDKMKMKLSTNLKELDAVYLPSDFTNQGVKRGIPELGDYGHNCIDLLDLIKRNSGCLISVTNETLYMYKKNDPFWVKTSNYILEDVEQLSQFTTNIEKISATKFVRFARDSSNEWTSANYKGTGAVESITPTNKGISLLYGYDEEEMPICLPSTYDKLTEIDYAIKNLLKVADSFSSVLGGNANFGKKFKSRFGAIKFSSDIHTMPYHLVSYPLPKNHRDLYNANIILENSNNYVSDNFANQEILFENKTIPLSTEDFFKIASNSTFTIKDGRVGRFKGSLEFNAEKKQALGLFAINSILSVKLNRDVYE
jgi:hypothetical protein